MDKKDPLCLENQLCFPLYACARQVVNAYRPFLDEIGLTYTQYIAMMVMWEEKTISVKELGHRLRLDSGTLTPVLKKLEIAGYITRTRSMEDERIVILNLSARGTALKKQAEQIPQQIACCIDSSSAEKMSKEERKALYDALYKFMDILEHR